VELLDWCGVATHVHTTFPHNPTCSGQQSIMEAAKMAQQLGLSGVAFAEHTTDPGNPSLGSDDLLDAIREQAADVERAHSDLHAAGSDLWLWSGVEANIMPGGDLDFMESELASLVRYIVASQHGGLGTAEKDPAAIKERLEAVCRNRYITTIGHPSRYNDEVAVDWAAVFAVAADTATAVEFNLNLWFSKGPGRGLAVIKDEAWYNSQLEFWSRWTTQLAESGAPVVIGLDVHNAGMWPQDNPSEDWMTTTGHLAAAIELLAAAGLKPERVINSSVERFAGWLEVPKYDRVAVL
jgi:histidinol phosphatase-like PHP family hydrolase